MIWPTDLQREFINNPDFLKVKEYARLKTALMNGAIQHDDQWMLFTKIWNSMLKELKMYEQIKEIQGYSLSSNKSRDRIFSKNGKSTAILRFLKFRSAKIEHWNEDEKPHLINFMFLTTNHIHQAILESQDEGLTLEKIKQSYREVQKEERAKNELFSMNNTKRNPFRTTGRASSRGSVWNSRQKR